jgi:hypothetical protein
MGAHATQGLHVFGTDSYYQLKLSNNGKALKEGDAAVTYAETRAARAQVSPPTMKK